MKVIDGVLYTTSERYQSASDEALKPMIEWFVESFGKRPDGNIYPERASEWDRHYFGAQQCYVWLGLSFHEGKLPFGKGCR